MTYNVTDLRVLSPEQIQTFEDHLSQPRCNLCLHPIVRLGMDWVCTEGCRCIMIGCVPRVKQPDP